VLKTRWQAEAKIEKKDPNAPKLSTLERINKIYRNEGFRGFYKGYVSRVLGIGPMRATYWGVMDHTTHLLEPVKQLNQWQRLVLAGTSFIEFHMSFIIIIMKNTLKCSFTC
jgi:hypothetical protein